MPAILPLIAQRDHLDDLVLEVHHLVALGEQPRAVVHPAQLHQVEPVGPEGVKVGRVDRLAQLVRLLCGGQRDRGTRIRPCSRLGHEHEVVPVIAEGLAHEPVGQPVAVELCRVDLPYPQVEGV